MLDFKLLLADALALIHAIYSVFVLLGLGWLVAGIFFRKAHPGRIFRLIHMGAVLALIVRIALGLPCPFSVLETSLRAGVSSHSAVVSLLHRLAFRNANQTNFQFSTMLVVVLSAGCNLIYLRSAPAGRKSNIMTNQDRLHHI